MEELESQQKPQLYGPVSAVIWTILIYIAAQLLAGILISIIPLTQGWTTEKTTGWLTSNVWATFGFVFIIEAITLGFIYLLLKHRNLKIKTLGLNKPQLKHVFYALVGFATYFVIYVIGLIAVKALFPSLNLEQEQEIGFSKSTQGIALIPVFLSLVILPPITEEIVARGFLYGGLRTKLPFIVSAIITSVLFAAAHLSGAKEGLLWVAAVDTFILSLVLCYLREKSGSLWPSIGLHALKNCLAFIVLFDIVQYIS